MNHGKKKNILNFSYKYHINVVADKGYDEKQFTSSRLTSEVLYLEDSTDRYEISCKDKKFTLKKVKILTSEEMENSSIPLNQQNSQVIQSGLNWHDFHWGINSLKLKGNEYFLKNARFLKIKQ